MTEDGHFSAAHRGLKRAGQWLGNIGLAFASLFLVAGVPLAGLLMGYFLIVEGAAWLLADWERSERIALEMFLFIALVWFLAFYVWDGAMRKRIERAADLLTAPDTEQGPRK